MIMLLANMAALTFQANINTMEVKGLEQLLSLSSPDVQRRLWNTMQAQSVLRSNFGVQLVEQGNKINNTQYTFTGLQEVYESMCLNLCGASHYPMTKLFGTLSGGHERHRRKRFEELLRLCGYPAGKQTAPGSGKAAACSGPFGRHPAGRCRPQLPAAVDTNRKKRPPTLPKSRLTASLVRFSPACWMCPLHSRSLRRLSDETGCSAVSPMKPLPLMRARLIRT